MTLIERDLLESRTVVIHDVQVERELVFVLVHRRECALVLVKQERLRLCLARGREDDAAVGKVLRHDVMADLGPQIIGNHPNQFSGVERVLPDIPGRNLVVLGDAHLERHAHGKEQAAGVVVNLDIADCA